MTSSSPPPLQAAVVPTRQDRLAATTTRPHATVILLARGRKAMSRAAGVEVVQAVRVEALGGIYAV